MKSILITCILLMALCGSVSAGVLERILLNAVTASGAGSAYSVSDSDNKTFHIIATSVSSGATVAIQTSLDGTNWATINTQTITANGTTEVAVNDFVHKSVRANITSYTDGTYTVRMMAKG